MEILKFRTSADAPWVEIAAIKGDAGPQGIPGLQGEAGPQGPKGDKGDTGPAGASYILTQEDKTEIAGMVKVDLSDYALKSELPDVSIFMTEEQVQALIDNAIGTIIDGNEVSY